MSDHVTDRLPLAAAGALEPAEQARVEAHLEACSECTGRAAAWKALGDGLRELVAPTPSPDLLARTRAAVERRQAEREERSWNRLALGFLIVFGWTLTGVAWLLLELLVGGVTEYLGRPLGPPLAWFAVYMVTGWLAAGAAALLLGRRTQEEGRLA